MKEMDGENDWNLPEQQVARSSIKFKNGEESRKEETSNGTYQEAEIELNISSAGLLKSGRSSPNQISSNIGKKGVQPRPIEVAMAHNVVYSAIGKKGKQVQKSTTSRNIAKKDQVNRMIEDFI